MRKRLALKPGILRFDGYRCSVLDGGVDFFDFVVRDGDAAGGPVFPLVLEFKEECRNLVRVAVDHDVAAGLVVTFFRGLDLLRVRIRNLQRQMKLAFGIVPLDGVIALGRLVVAGLDLCSDRILAQRNSVHLDNFIAVAHVHLALRFFYENVVNGGREHVLYEI